MVQLRYGAWKLSFKHRFEAFATWSIIIWVWVRTSFEQHRCIVPHRMRHIHVYTGSKSNEMSPPATSQGETFRISVTCKRVDRLAFISPSLPSPLHCPKHLGDVNSRCLTACKVSNRQISRLLKSKRSSSRSSNCRSLLTNGSCIWFHEYAKVTIVSFARGRAMARALSSRVSQRWEGISTRWY